METNPPPPFNRDYVRLLMVMRRFIKEEFNADVRISEEDAGARMLYYGEQSRNRVLREMTTELRELLPGLANAPNKSDEQPGESPHVATEAGAPVPTRGKVTRVYRGRPVYD